jgi:hypothetical protein
MDLVQTYSRSCAPSSALQQFLVFAVTLHLALSCLVHCAAAGSVALNFDDGVLGGYVGNAYGASGVTFSPNTQWDPFVSVDEELVGAGGMKISDATGAIYQPKDSTRVVATFASPVSSFSIRGLNVGINGVRIEAYDAPEGGQLVAFDEKFGVGNGNTNHPLLATAGGPFRRIEMYQPLSVENEGVLFDNMTFTPVPVPEPGTLRSTVLVMLTATAGRLRATRMRRRI